MVNVTQKAKDELKKILSSKDVDFLRISYGGAGWGGPRFDLTLEKSVNSDDNVFDQGDFKIAISKNLDGSYKNLEVDYVNSFLGKGFSISEKGKNSSGCC